MSCKTPEIKQEPMEVLDSEEERMLNKLNEEEQDKDDYITDYKDYGEAVLSVEAELNSLAKSINSRCKTIDISDWYLKKSDVDMDKKYEKAADKLYAVTWLNTLARLCNESGISVTSICRETERLWKRSIKCSSPWDRFIATHSKEIGHSVYLKDIKSQERYKEWKKTQLSKPKK